MVYKKEQEHLTISLTGITPISSRDLVLLELEPPGGENIYVTGNAQINDMGSIQIPEIEMSSDLPNVFSFDQNYPNPFHSRTTFSYSLPEKSHVNLTIFDILGRQVKILVDAHEEAGVKKTDFEPLGLASGMYIARLQVESASGEEYNFSKKVILAK